jgi:hypothetical protein
VAARKPVPTWGQPTTLSAQAQNVRVVNLVTVAVTPLSVSAKWPPGPGDSIVTSVLVFTTPVGTAAAKMAPDVAQLRAGDSLGQRHPVAYRELVRADGVTIGAVSVQATAGPRRTISVDIGAVRTGPGGAATVTGPWKIDLVEQLIDGPERGHTEAGFGYPTPPLQTPIGHLRALYWGAGVVIVTIDGPTGSQTIGVAGMEDGQPRVVSEEEFDRLQPRPPKPFVFGTALPGSPLR